MLAPQRRWPVLALLYVTLVALFDVLVTTSKLPLISVLVIGPLIAAVSGSVRSTALVGVYATVLAVLLGIPHDIFLSASHLVRIGVVAGGSAMAVLLARTRHRLDAARLRHRLIADTGVAVSAALDWEVGLIELARLCARRLADWCFVFVLEEDGRIRQVAAAHRDPERQRLAWELLSRYPLDPHRPEGPAKVIRSGEAELQPHVSDSLLQVIAADAENLRLLRALGLSSAMIVPLSAHGKTIGAIALASAESRRVFDRDDLAVAEEMAARAAISIDNARLFDRLRSAQASVRRSRDQLQAILDGVADAVTAQDRSGAIVYANDAAAHQLGLEGASALMNATPAELAHRYEMFDEDGRPLAPEHLPGRRALLGEQPEPTLLRYHLTASGEDRWALVKATAISDEQGEPILAINVVEDVTAQREREEQQRFLADSSKALGRSLDYRRTFPEVARLVVREVADSCAIELLEPDGGVRTVAFAHADPEKAPLVRALMERYPTVAPGRRQLPAPLRDGDSILRTAMTGEDLAAIARDPEHLAVLLELGVHSVIAVPMRARGQLVGIVSLLASRSGRRFDEDDVLLAEELAGRCALALDNARLYDERSRIARTLQESLLPPLLPEMPGIDVAARFRAAGQGIDVGGDFYDLFERGPGGWAVAIGDVCGKGSEAAAITALARYTVRAAAMRQDGPSQILSLLNEALLRQRADRRFCTVLFGHLSPNGRGASFQFASGGHPLPLVMRANGGGTSEAGAPGTLLGIVADPQLTDDGVFLNPGDAVVLYTDGVTDAGAPAFIRTPHELGAVAGSPTGVAADEIAERMMRAALDGAEGDPRDDIAIVVLKVPEI